MGTGVAGRPGLCRLLQMIAICSVHAMHGCNQQDQTKQEGMLFGTSWHYDVRLQNMIGNNMLAVHCVHFLALSVKLASAALAIMASHHGVLDLQEISGCG
jgi:hypothetical protein